jgi:hypothetical protein
MLSSKLFLILILSGLVFTIGNFTSNVHGHGLTSEILQGKTLDGQGVSLNLYSTTSPTEQNHREIFFELIDSETDELLNEVTFLIKVISNDKNIFEDSFPADDGVLILDMDMDSYSFSKIVERDSELDDPRKLKNAKMKNIPNLLSTEAPGGLYEFEIKILTTGSYSNELEEPIVFESGLSFPSSEFFEINTPNYGIQEFGLIGFYDKPYDFNYDSETREITFSMPYSWPEHKKEDRFFVHNEILIPKSFGDLRYENFSAYVNGIDQTESIFNVDFALEKNLQVHLVTDWKQFNELSEKLEDKDGDYPSVLEYLFVPTDPDEPFSSLTHGGRYRINLSWEPEEIVSGSETKFFIEILDIYTKDKPIPTEYHFTVIYGGDEIFHKSDLSTNPSTKTTELDFLVPDDVSGPITIRFENLGGGVFSNLDFPAVVNPIDATPEIIIPDWVRSTAKWWSLTQITDQDFAKGLEYLIQENIINVSGGTSSEGESEVQMPSWLRKNAGWWSQGLLSDDEFVKSIQWLVNNGFIKI